VTPQDLAALVVAALTGDADDLVEEGFAEDAVLSDQPGEAPAVGREAILAWFMAYGGRREVALVEDVFLADDRGGLAYTVWFRADAHAYGQHGRVLLTLAAGRITRWDGAWVELGSDLSPWAGD
jgi:hypothetical protein